MGCWNKTCGLSNLYITDNEPVYTFVLLQNDSEGRCYNTSFYTPVIVPFECKYDDYGGGTDAHGFVLAPLMEAIDKLRVKEPDDEVLTVDAFFELVHDGLTHKNFWGNERLVDFVMMRKDLVDHILDTWVREEYVGDYSPTGYISYTYANALSFIPEFIGVLTTAVVEVVGDRGIKDNALYSLFKMSSRSSLWTIFAETKDSYNLVYLALRNDIQSDAFVPNFYLIDLIAEGRRDDAITFVTDYLKGTFINSLIDSTRRQWLPGCHEGSQSNYHDGYRVLIDATAKILDAEEVCWDDE
jgi:hypothetical protein